MMEREMLLRAFFALGMSQNDIVDSLAHFGHVLSHRHLRRLLKSANLYRRKGYSDIAEVVLAIGNELSLSGILHGYRWMCYKLRAMGITVTREDVRLLLACLDPEGVLFRRSQRLHRRIYHAAGPHFAWHIDGYDKIKRFGFGIHGCVDGFSRSTIWLNVYKTNNDPSVIGGYFHEAISEFNGCPKIVRGDRGTENVRVKLIQEELVGNHTAYVQGASTSNQRIECFWSHLRKQCLEYWICLFANLEERGEFLGDFLDKNIAQFCFMAVIQTELDVTAKTWNGHVIRKSRRGLPSGRPNVMLEVPSLYGTHSFLTTVDPQALNLQRNRCTFRSEIPCDSDMYNLCCHELAVNGLAYPTTPDEAKLVYLSLRQTIRNLLNT